MTLTTLVRVELSRLLGKRLVRVILALPLLPILVSLALRDSLSRVFEAARALGARTDVLWLAMLGSPRALNAALGEHGGGYGSILGLSVVNVASFAWIIAILLAVYTFAQDVSSGRLALIASRPVSRDHIAAGKAVASMLILLILYAEAAAAAYVSAWIIAGRQAYPWAIMVYAILMAVASMPMLLLTGIAGLKLGRGGSTLAAGLAAYFLLSLLPLLVSIPYIRHGSLSEAERVMVYVNALEPVHSFLLPKLTADAIVAGLGAEYSLGLSGGRLPSVGRLLTLNAASTITVTAALLAAMVWYIRRLDVKVP
jgi:ABC-type transport system involved in multi-copper enzyme maturation permease subunit